VSAASAARRGRPRPTVRSRRTLNHHARRKLDVVLRTPGALHAFGSD
jgi:hypothetical protein